MQKFTVMQISKARHKPLLQCLSAIVLGYGALAVGSELTRAAETLFRSPEAALRQGLGAFRGGYYDIAEPALRYAADEDSLLAKFYLAQMYADNLGARTDHVRAFNLYRSIVDQYAQIDPDVDPRAPIVGQSMTAYAKYIKSGVSKINLKPNPSRARAYFNNASTTFNNEDAQFELAKMSLAGDGARRDVSLAQHWLSTLSQKGHAGAQAFLADMLWRGKHMKADPVRALALIVVAVKNAPPQERLWIEDIYQSIYCGAPNGVRKQATGVVAEWGKRYTRKIRSHSRHSRYGVGVFPVRTCQDGEYVGSIWEPEPQQSNSESDNPIAATEPAPTQVPIAVTPQVDQGFSFGGAGAPSRGLGFRGVSTPGPTRR